MLYEKFMYFRRFLFNILYDRKMDGVDLDPESQSTLKSEVIFFAFNVVYISSRTNSMFIFCSAIANANLKDSIQLSTHIQECMTSPYNILYCCCLQSGRYWISGIPNI